MSMILMFNCGYISQHIGTILQLYRIVNRKSTEGVCLDTQILFLLGAVARCIWIRETMLNESSLTYFELVTAVVSLVLTLYICLFRYNYYTIRECLNTTNVPLYVRWYVILVCSVILSLIFFPGNEDGDYEFDIQSLVSFSIFVESSGLLPQIITIHREKDSNNFSRSYIVLLFISRLFRMAFWYQMYLDDNTFYYLLLADCINLIMVGGFIYAFFTNLDKLALPTEHSKKFM
jgi:hypothetical protein